jgi:hypothetical protein
VRFLEVTGVREDKPITTLATQAAGSVMSQAGLAG